MQKLCNCKEILRGAPPSGGAGAGAGASASGGGSLAKTAGAETVLLSIPPDCEDLL